MKLRYNGTKSPISFRAGLTRLASITANLDSTPASICRPSCAMSFAASLAYLAFAAVLLPTTGVDSAGGEPYSVRYILMGGICRYFLSSTIWPSARNHAGLLVLIVKG